MRRTFRTLILRPHVWSAALLVAFLIGATAARPHASAPTELFFSEYIEGSSNNKALEIYNGTGVSVDLVSCNRNK